MNALERNYQKLKTMDDFRKLDAPEPITAPELYAPIRSDRPCPHETQMILRMLVRPKYGPWRIPPELQWIKWHIRALAEYDRRLTGIRDSWCYVTVRHGPVVTKTDDEWHFDGASFRTGLIPERNYIWVDHTPMQYKMGNVEIPESFDPNKHNLFTFFERMLADAPIHAAAAGKWNLINPFCFHRRNPDTPPGPRTFIRVAFTDIEGRDVNNTPNPLLDTPAFGRDPVKSFRDKLVNY